MDISAELLKMDAFTDSFCQSLDDVKAKSEEAANLRVKLRGLKSTLREAEDDFAKMLGAKTRKEARQVEMQECISVTRGRIEELRKSIEIKKRRRDEYRDALARIHKDDSTRDLEYSKKSEIEEANLWYKTVLGIQIDSGHGVKFLLSNIDEKAPHVQYTFTVRLDGNTYTLLACDPQVEGSEELVKELNRTNGLYEFVRKMRQKFQESALRGYTPQQSFQQNTVSVTASAPEISMSTGASISIERVGQQSQNQQSKNRHGMGSKYGIVAPSSTRSSPRLKAKNKKS